MKIAVFVSGRGSNLKAILESPELKNLIQVVCVISDKQDCPAFILANQHQIQTFVLGAKENQISFSELIDILRGKKVELIVLAGFLKLIPEEFITSFENKIINIHPALLPSFGGKGMYGMNVHQAVYDSSTKVSGATVHFVDKTFDTGTIIDQSCIDISNAETAEEIARRVLAVEHKLLPSVIKAIAEGRVKRINNRVMIK